ncbi:unnamed protein product [Rhizoctonia solani]|uniref:Uncharacterized protein n=1 Tax=Rhizoctonia solani TaxID=456999 RepID=A0A8H3DNY8_9AGAM|nr:unnamed protein product [Rhizoctonia solani]
MVIAGGVQSVFAKLGFGHPHQYYAPYEPYADPEPKRSLRKVSSSLSMRQRKPSLVQSACLSVQKIPAIVAVSGSPESPSPRARFPSGASRPVAARNPRHSIAGSGWHQLLSPDDGDTRYAFPKQAAQPNVDAPSGTRADRSHTVPAAINVPSFDFCDLDQNKQPSSAPSQQTTFEVPNIQVTAAERRPAETHHQYTHPPTATSYDFIDMDRGSLAPLSALRSPSQSSIRRSPSPTMGQSYRSPSPTVGHTPNYPGSQRHDSPLRTSHTPQRTVTPLQRPSSTSPAAQTAVPESYDFIGVDQPSPTSGHENSEYGAYYSTSPTPIFTYGSTHGASRGNTYDSRRGDITRGNTYVSTQDNYEPEPHHGGATRMTYGQETGPATLINEMQDYNRNYVPRSVPALSPSPTTTISVDGTLDSPYFDRERDSAFPNQF